MKTLRKMKKGFTIVELVIVIAVIAVLTAILVPTFISISNKANEASDKSLVKNLNTALRMAEGDQGAKNKTMHDAVLDVEEYAGIKLSQYVSKTGDEILWDSVNDEFVWKTAKPQGRADHLLWTIAKTYVSSAQTFSMYAGHEWTAAKSVAGLKVGFDVGFHKDFESIEYVGTSSTDTIRTNGSSTKLTVNGNEGTIVYHYGLLGEIDIIKCGKSSFHARGDIGYARLDDGRIVADSDGYVAYVLQVNATSITDEDGGTIGDVYGDSTSTDEKNGNVDVHPYDSEQISVADMKAAGKTAAEESYYTKHPEERPEPEDPYLALVARVESDPQAASSDYAIVEGENITFESNSGNFQTSTINGKKDVIVIFLKNTTIKHMTQFGVYPTTFTKETTVIFDANGKDIVFEDGIVIEEVISAKSNITLKSSKPNGHFNCNYIFVRIQDSHLFIESGDIDITLGDIPDSVCESAASVGKSPYGAAGMLQIKGESTYNFDITEKGEPSKTDGYPWFDKTTFRVEQVGARWALVRKS